MDDTQLPVEPLVPRILSEDLRAPMAEGTVGDTARSPTEEHRMHVAFKQQLHIEENSQGRPGRGNEVEMQMHTKVIANFLVLMLLLHHQINFKCIILGQNYNNATTCF